MKASGVVAVGLSCAWLGGVEGKKHHGYVSAEEWIPREKVGPAKYAHELVADEALPNNFDWRDVKGKNLVTADWNQHIPQYCGGCWIHGTLSAYNDRLKVMRGGQFPDIRLGRQGIVNCVPDPDGVSPPPGCNGGDPWMIHKHLKTTKMPDDTCLPYEAKNMGCEPINLCRNCLPAGPGLPSKCWTVPNFIGYGVSSYGDVNGEVAMMKEIFARGPIVCSFATDDDFVYNYSENAIKNEGVYVPKRAFNVSEIDHNMEVAGWGVTKSGMKYWVIRNSWGTYWGQSGWLKLLRGSNELQSESDCSWAIPTWDGLNDDLAGQVWGSYDLGTMTKQQVEDKITPPGVVLAEEPPVSFGAAVFGSFVVGVAVATIVAKVAGRSGKRDQPFILH